MVPALQSIVTVSETPYLFGNLSFLFGAARIEFCWQLILGDDFCDIGELDPLYIDQVDNIHADITKMLEYSSNNGLALENQENLGTLVSNHIDIFRTYIY